MHFNFSPLNKQEDSVNIKELWWKHVKVVESGGEGPA